MKKIVGCIASVMLAVVLGSCALFGGMTKKETYHFTNDRPVFVGVYQGLNTDKTITVFKDFDVLRNEYKGYFHFKAKNAATFGLTYTLCRATIQIKTEKGANGETIIFVKAEDPRIQESDSEIFKEYNLDLVNVENNVAELIRDAMNVSEEEFEENLTKTISSLDFLYSACYGMNSVAFKKWMDSIKITERNISVKFLMYELKELKKGKHKYQITGVYYPDKRYYAPNAMYITFDTSNEEYIKYRKDELITVTGKIKTIEQNNIGEGFIIRMED